MASLYSSILHFFVIICLIYYIFLLFSLCPRCFILFSDPKNEEILKETESWIVSYILNDRNIISFPNEKYINKLCPCCLNALRDATLSPLAKRIHILLIQLGFNDRCISIQCTLPPVLDILRVATRTTIMCNTEKLLPFPNLDELLVKLVGHFCKTQWKICTSHLGDEPPTVTVQIQPHLANQTALCKLFYPTFVYKRKRYVTGNGTAAAIVTDTTANLTNQDNNICNTIIFKTSNNNDDNNSNNENLSNGSSHSVNSPECTREITRKESDSVLVSFKSLDRQGLQTLSQTLKHFVTAHDCHADLTWHLTAYGCPVYLLGRYRKWARDVPQAAWTVTDTNSAATTAPADVNREAEDAAAAAAHDACDIADLDVHKKNDNANSHILQECTVNRIGRLSVEEIVSQAVSRALKAGGGCRMHPCGREDIDVRMTGNGRPFVLEVIKPMCLPTEANLAAAIELLRSSGGKDDVEVLFLEVASPSLWSTIQMEAENKNKGYRALIWSQRAVTAAELQRTLCDTHLLFKDVDEDGAPCLAISQLTPLRVLHRRSLLKRQKYIYSLKVQYLNQHFFYLDIVTSAGTYVKEFVHGDLGRTHPSMCSILNCQADILQLDVIWLYDNYRGGGGSGIDANLMPTVTK